MLVLVPLVTIGWCLLLTVLMFRKGQRQRQDKGMLSGDRVISYLLPIIPLGSAIALVVVWAS